MLWLLCVVMFTVVSACTGEKGASGQNAGVPQARQENAHLTHGKDRENAEAVGEGAPERVVGETNAKGKYSGRDFHTDKAGGPIQNLDWKGASIDGAGVDKVKLHTGRFGELPENKVMINRLEKILKGELQATDTDRRFYTHEIRELERYRALGVPDGVAPDDDGATWNNTHTATLEDDKLSSDRSLLYTPEALKAADE